MSVIQPHHQDTGPHPSTMPSLGLSSALRVEYRGATVAGPLDRTLDGRHTIVEAIGGDTLGFSWNAQSMSAQFFLVRSPAAPKPDNIPSDGPIFESWAAAQRNAQRLDNGGRVQLSRPGLWTVRLYLAGPGLARDVNVACFPPEALDRMELSPQLRAERRGRLRRLIDLSVHGEIDATSVVCALETHGGDGCAGISEHLMVGGKPLPNIRDLGV